MSRRPAPRPRVRLLVLDVDGVLTDGRLYYGARGEALKVFHVRDGYGLVQLRRAGCEVAVISGRRSPMVRARCRELGIRYLQQGVTDKLARLRRLLQRLRLPLSACACVGDDLPELPLMRAIPLSFAVADAHPEIRRAAARITRRRGGRGAVREVCDYLLRRP
ncbi:MAG: HAD hydrolase family protein [Gammaproteobacteria bacterium]|nr:HAD hydrolase family protein [Gammaproteobacteria bacterium]MBV9622240.1 HAD hydrolase family protein [Gammaproteobacteria bacterium]